MAPTYSAMRSRCNLPFLLKLGDLTALLQGRTWPMLVGWHSSIQQIFQIDRVSGLSRTGPNRSGAARGIRTPDPIITNDVLYRLSYCGPGAVITLGWGHCKQGLELSVHRAALVEAGLAEQRPPPTFLLWLGLSLLGFGRRWALRTRIVRCMQEAHRRWLRLRR